MKGSVNYVIGRGNATPTAPVAQTVAREIFAFREKYLIDGVMADSEEADNVPRGTYVFDHIAGKLSFNGNDLSEKEINELKTADRRFTYVMDAECTRRK